MRLIACLLLALLAGLLPASFPAMAQGPAEAPADVSSVRPIPEAGPLPDVRPAEHMKVTVGAYINDIQGVNLEQHSYAVDLYVWFRWTDPDYDPVNSVEFMNLFDSSDHTHVWAYEEPQPQPDGSLYNVVRHQGLFSTKFPLGAYPFDSQTLVISMEDTVSGSDDLRFVADADRATLNPDIRLPGYGMRPAQLVITDKAYPTAFGDLANPETGAYSRVEIRLPVVRPWASGLFKVMAPILLIILTATFALLLDPDHIDARIGLSITALLTLVALQFTLLSGLPEVAYLTLLDQVFLASYGYILMVIALVVRATRVDQIGQIRRNGAFSIPGPAGAIGLLVAYFTVVVALVHFNIRAQTG